MSTAPLATAEKYLSVILQSESYGIPVLQIREIIRLQKITPVPQTPSFVRGVINLRGRVIPIIDLRAKFGLPSAEDEHTCIVVVQLRPAGGQLLTLGLVVDRVNEVLTLAAGDIEPPPEFGVHVDTAFLRGMAKVRDQVTTLIELNSVFRSEDLAVLETAA